MKIRIDGELEPGQVLLISLTDGEFFYEIDDDPGEEAEPKIPKQATKAIGRTIREMKSGVGAE